MSILSYAGDVTIGVAADRNLVPDPQVLVAAAEDELADLVRVTLGVPDDAVQLDEVPFDSELAQSLVAEVQQEYVRRYGGQDETPIDPAEFAPPDGSFLVAWEMQSATGELEIEARRVSGAARGACVPASPL